MDHHRAVRASLAQHLSPSRRFLLALAAVSLAVGACSREASVWEDVHRSDTIPEYERYLAAYPDGEHVAAARQRMEEIAWQVATTTDTVAAFRSYLDSYPGSSHKDAATDRIGFLRDAAWWERLGSAEFLVAHGQDLASNLLQIDTVMEGMIKLDHNMQFAWISPKTKILVSVVETRKGGNSVREEYTFVKQFGGVGLFRSEKRGALVLLTQNLVIPLPTREELDADPLGDSDDAHPTIEQAILAKASASDRAKAYDVFSIWKRNVLTSLKAEVDQTDFDNVKSHIAIFGLVPIPGVERWLSDERFKRLPNAPKIIENRKKLLEAIPAAGSIRIAHK